MPDPSIARVTVGIVTHNRPDSLRTCLASLAALGSALAEIVVVDDTGDVPLDDVLGSVPTAVRLIRQTDHEGYIVARNTIVRGAATEAVLLMDDDAALLPGPEIVEALGVFESHPRIGAIACAMAESDGSPWPARMQPAPVDYTCRVPAVIGFAHIVRRSVFLQLGGYRESFQFYGEEKDYGLRLLQAGYDVVYMPRVRVVHAPDPAGRNQSRYVRHVIRNDCLFALYNEPLPLPLVSVPIRLSRYSAMSRGLDDRGGFGWIVRDLLRQLPRRLADRRPVSWSTFARWRRVARTWPAFA